MTAPRVVIVLSGKRKSGKDFITGLLEKLFEQQKWSFASLRLSAPLKRAYAKENNLDFEELLSANSYKEDYRAKMIAFGEAKRNENPEYFCRLTTEGCTNDIWVIPDARRLTDLQYFLKYFPDRIIKMRINSTEQVREERGFQFTPGIDDAESECGLDGYLDWDFVIENNNGSLDVSLNMVLKAIEKHLKE